MGAQRAKSSHPRRVSALRDRGPRKGSKAHAAGLRAALEASGTKKTKSVAGRITEEQQEKLALLGAVAPALAGTSAALARAIEIAFEAAVESDAVAPLCVDTDARSDATSVVTGRDAGEAEERPSGPSGAPLSSVSVGDTALSPVGGAVAGTVVDAVAVAVADALSQRTRSYSELVKQVRAIGHQNNQLVKLAHQGVTYHRVAVVPEGAVLALDAKLQLVLDQLVALAAQDAETERVVRQCL